MGKNLKNSLIALFGVLLPSCHHHTVKPEQDTHDYYKAEVYYMKDPGWGSLNCFYFADFFDQHTRSHVYNKFTLHDLDSLKFIKDHIRKSNKTSTDLEYWDPKIVVLMYSMDRTDTLFTNLQPQDLMQFNSERMTDATLTLFLAESVGKHDNDWADSLNLYFYNGAIQNLTCLFGELHYRTLIDILI